MILPSLSLSRIRTSKLLVWSKAYFLLLLVMMNGEEGKLASIFYLFILKICFKGDQRSAINNLFYYLFMWSIVKRTLVWSPTATTSQISIVLNFNVYKAYIWSTIIQSTPPQRPIAIICSLWIIKFPMCSIFWPSAKILFK